MVLPGSQGHPPRPPGLASRQCSGRPPLPLPGPRPGPGTHHRGDHCVEIGPWAQAAENPSRGHRAGEEAQAISATHALLPPQPSLPKLQLKTQLLRSSSWWLQRIKPQVWGPSEQGPWAVALATRCEAGPGVRPQPTCTCTDPCSGCHAPARGHCCVLFCRPFTAPALATRGSFLPNALPRILTQDYKAPPSFEAQTHLLRETPLDFILGSLISRLLPAGLGTGMVPPGGSGVWSAPQHEHSASTCPLDKADFSWGMHCVRDISVSQKQLIPDVLTKFLFLLFLP